MKESDWSKKNATPGSAPRTKPYILAIGRPQRIREVCNGALCTAVVLHRTWGVSSVLPDPDGWRIVGLTYLGEEIAGAVDHLGLPRKAVRTINKPDQLDYARHSV